MPEVDLRRLLTPKDYQSENAHAFPSMAALQWFMRCHREELARNGALAKINRRFLIAVPRFNAVVLAVGRAAATDTIAEESK